MPGGQIHDAIGSACFAVVLLLRSLREVGSLLANFILIGAFQLLSVELCAHAIERLLLPHRPSLYTEQLPSAVARRIRSPSSASLASAFMCDCRLASVLLSHPIVSWWSHR